jgi:hypothetical protein
MQHDQVERAIGVPYVVDAADIRMIQRRDGARLTLEARPRIGIVTDLSG